ncbi:IS3 family transposase [Streptococcus mitis]
MESFFGILKSEMFYGYETSHLCRVRVTAQTTA